MRHRFATLIAVCLLTVMHQVGSAEAQTQVDFDTCWKRQMTSTLDAIVKACSSVIGSDRITEENRAVTYFMRGFAWSRHGELDHAIEDLSEAVRLSPQFALPYAQRAVVWHRKGEIDRALSDYETAIERDPDNAIAHYGRGLVMRQRGDRKGWLADLETATASDPQIADLFAFQGVK